MGWREGRGGGFYGLVVVVEDFHVESLLSSKMFVVLGCLSCGFGGFLEYRKTLAGLKQSSREVFEKVKCWK